MRDLIYGKDTTERIVSIEVEDDTATLFVETADGVETREVDNRFWFLFAEKLSPKFAELKGKQHYRYLVEYDSRQKASEIAQMARDKRYDYFSVYNPKESLMIKDGFTYFKGMRVSDVSVLSFDIETNTGLDHNPDSKVLLISNTLRTSDGLVRKSLFAIDDFADQAQMLDAWANWVRGVDPSIICGHNIFGYDLPYMAYVADRVGVKLRLGRDGSPIRFEKKPSEFRKDGSQTYTYHDAHIFGREIVDTFFLSIKYDVGRKYDNYKLKGIIAQEGLEKADRQHYDGAKIAQNWQIPEEWAKIKAYAKDDADDALALYDLMIPSFFYYTQSVPMPLQRIINTATGRQVNSIMLRAYLQQGHSIPQASPSAEYEGAISFGNPGIYKHVYKVDVASLYPSIIREYQVHDSAKDPDKLFLAIVEYFTDQRLENKRLAKDTGDRYYKDLEQAQKIVINSAYGFLGAERLNFNSPENAALVTKKGREILNRSIAHAEACGYTIVNADTDSISFTGGKKLPQFQEWLDGLNVIFPKRIRWEDDGYYKTVIVVKAKNYVLEDEKGNVKIKGSGLKGTMKERALQCFMKDVIGCLLKGRKDRLYDTYQTYVRKINTGVIIEDWAFKKTITKAVLDPERTTEERINDAIDLETVSEGDKVFLYYKTPTELARVEEFDGTYDRDRLYKKLFDTLCVFETIVDVDLFPNYALKRNKELLCDSPSLSCSA
ncbi:PolB DNA polymerase elongation subunit (family B) [uncultured Caudovirales phage]|uniref:DNA-directed DNA polymerase n=1 Tax=uncultured Caudovirales phage TaxID=2100421 RepID=A0A6J5S1F0_9CAUD|nr:PolB DNA polymerase elongation subunit (family B) [uncultured Caudovirales phage]